MARRRILIIEDDVSIQKTLKLALELEGFEVRCASNGKEALDMLASKPLPQLILLDLMMPIMDGWEFTATLREDARLAKIPVVVITAFADRAQTLKPLTGILIKPIDLDMLFDTIHRLFDGGRAA